MVRNTSKVISNIYQGKLGSEEDEEEEVKNAPPKRASKTTTIWAKFGL